MPEEDERLSDATQRVENALGFMSDAEFREEHETRQIRYLQAMSNTLVAIYLQNQVMLEMLQEQQRLESLSRE
ncbi:MAG: hypothetical protein ACOC7S_00525 [Planctomycetota bacterium]